MRTATPAAGVRAAAAAPGELSVENLGGLDSSLLVLATEDGRGAAQAPASSAFEGPGTFEMPGTFDAPNTFELAGASDPLAAQARPGSPAKAAAPAPDMFEPPPGDAFAVELAPDELEHQSRKRAATPLPVPAAPAPSASPASPVLQRRPQSEIQQHQQQPEASADAAPAAMPRARFAAGVVLAVVLGFVPAHLVAATRERSAFRKIDDHVVQVQTRADEPLDDAALDAFRAEQKARKQSERRSIALTSLAIWALVSVGLAHVWFRRIPWDRLSRSS